ncbi:MAG: T9SS type A sorting domain-containing protein [Bacteroidota bacterium]
MKKFVLFSMVSLLSFAAGAQCTELFYSEYVEGSSHSKAVEIYNPTNNSISLVGYRIARYSNGSTSISDSYDLTGTVAAHDVWVVTNGVQIPDGNGAYCDSVLYAMGDEHSQNTYPSPLHMNGDDALTLEKISNGAIVDIFGKIGEDPGGAWTDDASAGYTDANGGTWWSANHTLIRKSSVTSGVITNPLQFNPTTQWDSLSINNWTNLGIHSCACDQIGVNEVTTTEYFYLFPNPAENTVLIKGTETISNITVVNVLGEVVFTEEKSNGRADHQLDVQSWNAGMYFVTIEFTNGDVVTQRLIRK